MIFYLDPPMPQYGMGGPYIKSGKTRFSMKQEVVIEVESLIPVPNGELR